MSTKLDVVIQNQSVQLAAVKTLSEDVSRLKEWRIQIDTMGSPAVVRRLDDLKKDHDDLAKTFGLHIATTTKP